MENIIISKEFLDWYEYYNECKEKYSSLVNDVEDKLICGKYKDIELPFSNMNTNNLNRDISNLEKIQVLMMQGSTSQINVEIELVKEKMSESCLNVNFGILCNPLASTLYRMILDSSRVKKHIEDVSKQCKENEFYTSVFIPVYLRHFYASICEECIKGYSSYEFVQAVDSLIEEDKFSEACSLCPIYEEIYIHANKKGLLTKELIQVMQQYGVNVPVSVKKKETPPKIMKKSKLDIETRKKIVGDGVKEILDMSDDELIQKYDGKSEDEVQEMLYEEPWCEDEYFDDDLLAFLSVLTCMRFDFENVFINWLAHFIFRRLLDIHKKVMVESPKIQSKKTVKTTPPKVQSSKVSKVNQGGAPRTKSPKIRSEHVSQPSRKTNQSRASVAIKQKETSNGKGGIIFLIIIGLLFGYGYISLKKEEAEWDMEQKQYRIESRRKSEQNEFKVREEKRKKKEEQSSNSSSSSSSSYDEGSDDAYSGDYDENRYDNDENYRDGVDDMLDELGE
ncbi:MAG: hypothetical protein UDK37_11670 [Holdemanella biformis]|uniref:hypothetical protein n=1 Tax=Holdemanella biformis TaxID=1735 RepID=UPI00242B906D|nr:hypothetical protein [Holdemanella biformis]MBS6258583.1 hypothetical protein [Holdemanella biformis]MEE0474541.1 hypothetical protein [Holdemanella biformis]